MILAAPLVIPFAEAVGLSVATLGMAKVADMVNEYIQENPEQSMKILSTIVPGVGIGEIFMKKGKDEEVEEDIEVEDVDARDLTKKEKAKKMKELVKEGGNLKETMKKGYEEIILPGKEDEMLDEAEDRYEGGVEEVSKPKFDYKKFFKKRYADGGSIGIEVLFEKKKDGGRAGSTMKPKRGLVNEPGGYAGLTAQQQALLGLQLQSDPEFQTGYYKATPELEFEDFYKAPTGPLRYVDEVKGSSSYFDENIDNVKFEPRGPLRDLDMDRTVGIIDALDTKDPSGELGFNYMDRIKSNPDGTIYETIQTNKPKFAEFQQIPEDQITKDMTPTNFKNLGSTNKEGVFGYTTLPNILPSEYGTKFQTETNPVYLNKDLAEFITTKPMSPANQLPLYTEAAAKLGFYGAKPADLLNQAVDTVQHEYAHNITKFPEFANVMKNTMDAGIPLGLQLKGKPGDGISKFDKEELFTRALDIERRLRKDGTLNSPNVDMDLNYINSILSKKYRNLNKDGQSMAIQYINAIRPQVQNYFNEINQRATANRARTANPDVYASADRQGFTDGRGGGFASRSTGTNENFSNKTGRGRTGYDDGGRVGLFMGGPALDGQALSIYNSMNAYGFSDQEIANALQEQGLYDPNASTPDPTPDPGQSQGGGIGGGSPESVFGRNLDSTFTRLAGSKPKFSEDAFFGLGKFFQGKEQGTLGDRRLQAYNNPMLPSFFGAIGRKFSPFNPDSRNYNPDMATQLNFLEMGQIGDETGLSLVGYDPGSGLMKYGSDSVLAGKNVTSMFGTNNYEKALLKYKNAMLKNTRVSPEKQKDQLDKVNEELKAIQEKQIQGQIAREADTAARARAANAAVYASADKQGFTNRDGGFSTSRADRAGTSVGSGQFSPKSSRGRRGYSQGGLATMFKEKR